MRDLAGLSMKINDLFLYFDSIPETLTVYIFGSFGTALQTAISDIDFAILFIKKISLLREMEIAAEISSLLGMEHVDLVNLNTAPVYIQHKIISTADIIYEKSRFETSNFIEHVLEIHHDYSIIFDKYNRDFYEGLKEELSRAR